MASPVLGIGDAIRASHICGIKNAKGASPVIGIVNAKGASHILGIGIAISGENDAAQTAPTNQQQYLPPPVAPNRMLTRHHLRTTATQIQTWYRHHSLRRSCVQRNRALHYALTSRANQAAITLQHCWHHYLYDSSPPPLEHHLIPWVDPAVTTHHRGYHPSSSSTH